MPRIGETAIATIRAAARMKLADIRMEGRVAVIGLAPGLKALSMDQLVAEPWKLINE